MPLTKKQVTETSEVLRKALRTKFLRHNPEPASMPFHTRLLGKDRMALYSFMHSLITNFGTTFFEPVAKAIASLNFKSASSQQVAGTKISSEAFLIIEHIMNGLTTATTNPDKLSEIEVIRAVCKRGEMKNVRLTKVDIKLISKEEMVYLIDIKTAKPNTGGFKELKRTLLQWIAAFLAENPNAKVQSLIAIPYNPYEPEPYNRWTMRGMLDLPNELKVANEFWDFLAGEGTFLQLLDIFEKVGIELKTEIDGYFAKFI